MEKQIKLGHDKAASCFSYIFPSTLWIPVKFGTYGRYFRGESNAVGCKKFEEELVEDVRNYREMNQLVQIRNISAFLFRMAAHCIRKQCPELLEAQGAMRASRPYREVIVSASAR